jgi:hypothetical protein
MRMDSLLDEYHLDCEEQRILDDLLRSCLPDVQRTHEWHADGSNVERASSRAGGNVSAMLRAMRARIQWLSEREPKPPIGSEVEMVWFRWRSAMHGLCQKLIESSTELTAGDLAALCDMDALRWVNLGSRLLDLCEARISRYGFEAELVTAMHGWAKTLYGTNSALTLRKTTESLLWFDTTTAVDENRCWSSIIRKDLRAMAPENQRAWIALLRNTTTLITPEPTKKWLKPASELLAVVGADEFRTRLRAWLEPFRSGKPLKITVTGRDILIALFWYARLAKDPKVDEAICWFATAKWKAKTDLDRTARLLSVWVRTLRDRCPDQAVDVIHAYAATDQLELQDNTLEIYNELCERAGRTPELQAPPKTPIPSHESLVQKQMGKLLPGLLGSQAALDGDSITVADPHGLRYTIDTRHGRIVRLSDNKIVRLEIDWDELPFKPFKGIVDTMDLMYPLRPNYARAMFCAQVLSGSLPIEVPLVLDED